LAVAVVAVAVAAPTPTHALVLVGKLRANMEKAHERLRSKGDSRDQVSYNAFNALAAGQQQQLRGAEEQGRSMHHGGSFGQYMATKVTKLREQVRAGANKA
jgi:hypothetical protein